MNRMHHDSVKVGRFLRHMHRVVRLAHGDTIRHLPSIIFDQLRRP